MPNETRIRAEDSPRRHEGTEQEEKKIGRKEGRRSDSYLPTFFLSYFLTFSSLRVGGRDSWETKPIGARASRPCLGTNKANVTVSACKYRIYVNTTSGVNPFDRRAGGSYNRGDAEGSTEQTTV